MSTVGECYLRRQHNDTTFVDELHIDRADPHVLITLDIIDQAIHQPNHMLWTMTTTPAHASDCGRSCTSRA